MRNNNNYVSNNTNSIFIILISLFIIVFIIVGYFMLSDNIINSSYKIKNPQKLNTNCVSDCSNENEKEVFNIRDNMFSYDEAQAVCKAYNSELATLEQMIKAYKRGANWCSYGWSEGQLALYPTQSDFWNKLQNDPHRKNECGKPGVNGGYFENPNYKFGANCYGNKPKPKSNEREKDLYFRDDPLQVKVDQYKEQKNDIRISPFSRDDWSNHSK
jgi:hypothetical protein